MTGLGVSRPSEIPTEGRLEGTSIPELLCALAREAATGALMLERGQLRKVLYLRDGRVVFAASSDPEDRLGSFLLRRGEVRLAPLLEASGQVARGRRLGQILVDSGVMDPGAVVRAVIDQVREIALSVFPWREGNYRLSRVALPSHESITLDLPMETLVLTGIKRVRDWRWVRRAVGGPRAVYRRADGYQPDLASLGMTERAIHEQLQRPARVDLLCREIYAPSYDVYRALWGLAIIGAVQREDPRLIPGFTNQPQEGFLPAGGALELLLELGARRFTGALRLFSAGLEGALFLQNGRIQFATTNDPERTLVTHLLRRGVISDRDHDDAVRRLLSGKRIGTILAERGALQPEEVERFVREQLLEVARSLAQWLEGEFTLEEGVTLGETVTLDASVEDVTVEACTALETFDRIWSELGGLATLLRLRRDYLDRLDRMTLRPTIWELVSLLGRERTIEELLAARPEPDFELVRLIYALERAGVIERVSEAEILVRAREARATPPVASSWPVPQDGEPQPSPAPEQPAIGTAGTESSAAGADATERALQAQDALAIAPELFSATLHRQEPPRFETRDELIDGEPPPATASVDEGWLSEAVPPEIAASGSAPVESNAEVEPSGVEPIAQSLEPEQAAAESTEEPFSLVASECEIEPPAAIDERFESAALDSEQVLDSEQDLAREQDQTAAGVEPPLAGLPASAQLQPAAPPEPLEEPNIDPPIDTNLADELELSGPHPSNDDVVAPDLDRTLETARPAFTAGSTLEIPREIIAAALAGTHQTPTDEAAIDATIAAAVDDAGPTAGSPAFELDTPEVPPLPAVPEAVFAEVDRFNRRHALVFQEIRLEIGAGARNFVLTCIRRLGPYGVVFDELEPDRQGAFDREALARGVLERWSGPLPEALDGLIEMELSLVGDLLTPARRSSLLQTLAGIS